MPAKKTIAPAPKISPARQSAFQILRALAASPQMHSDDLLQGRAVKALSPQDRHLCTALVMGVLRWQAALDAQIGLLLTHKSKMDEPVRIALRLGVFQMLFLDRIPVHAAISDSVELTKRAGHRFASGLVNAVLRKAVPLAAPTLEETSKETRELLREKLGSEAAHPAWLVERWKHAYGQDQAHAVCDYDQQQPQTVLRLLSTGAASQLESQGVLLEPGAFLSTATRVASGSITQEHEFRWQDEGSQLIAELLGAGPDVKTILDCCAAPGGKTAILAERYPTARVVACDISATRLEQMQERFRSSPALANIVYQVGDMTQMPVDGTYEGTYDLVLCDVPCSGTGTLARNPEIRQRLQVEDLARQQQRQVAILSTALRHLAPGGRLVYSTCSLEREEGETVVERVLTDAKDAQLIPITVRLDELTRDGVLHRQGAEHLLAHAVRGHFLRTIPGVSPCDGFFAALLTRT